MSWLVRAATLCKPPVGLVSMGVDAILRRMTSTTVIFVAYGVTRIDMSWIPASADVIIVHNDSLLSRGSASSSRIRHLHPGRNAGFAGGVNAALPLVQTDRIIVCNPDTRLSKAHWVALTASREDEVATIPLVDGFGATTWVSSTYPTPLGLILMAYRTGRIFRRSSRIRRILGLWLEPGSYTADRSERATVGQWLLSERWASGAVLAIPTARLRAVGGFDTRYFLYMEDVDLCSRLARMYPEMRVRVASVPPAIHMVGGSASDPGSRRAVDRHHYASISMYLKSFSGPQWRLAGLLIAPRRAWLAIRSLKRRHLAR